MGLHPAPYSSGFDSYSTDDMAERHPLGAAASQGPPRHGQYPHPSRHPQHPQHPPQHPQDSYRYYPDSQSRQPAQHDPAYDPAYDRPPPPSLHARQPYRDSPPSSRQSPNPSPDRSWGRSPAGYAPPPQQQQQQQHQRLLPGPDDYNGAGGRGMDRYQAPYPPYPQPPQQQQQQQQQQQHPAQGYYGQQPQQQQQQQPRGALAPGDYPSHPGDRSSYGSSQNLGAAASASGYSTPGRRTPGRPVPDFYTDDPYQSLSRHQGSDLGIVNPNDIADDGDDGLDYGRRGPRTSMLSLGSSRNGRNGNGNGNGNGARDHSPAVAAAAGAAGGGLLAGANLSANRYDAMHSSSSLPGDGPAGGSRSSPPIEKSALEAAGGAEAGKKKRKWKLFLLVAIALLVIAGAVVGVLFGVVFKKDGSSGGGGSSGPSHVDTAEEDLQHNGDLNADSAEIKALMNNPNLRKVFVGMDYTPLNTQYPECLTHPPSQNNVTRDLAVLSQLTNVVRLYGTDCNQTEMLIHAVNQLRLKDTVKIWLGVWQDNNATTNARQIDQMWTILDTYGESYFKGVIVANEILFREQMTASDLGQLLEEVRANMTARGMKLPVTTSDLGDRWDASLAASSDAIMANIHPFFAGEPAAKAAAWTMQFWANKMSGFLKPDPDMNIIAETGWPSQGGTGCGNAFEIDCPHKAVAGIEELNVFMEDFVCQALKNGTQYLWFEAFDEPWKIRFNEKGKEWEDHWGLLTVNRELKDGVKIPDCGGMRVD
ncbi:hypothetical protein VTJ83DRAFT_6029 [Remersonia thermophila]|uniref:glucan endo-1,3-beta-D-glucosidase n=1 Tax=Remersonia thermophila TaxID=72144 RepID=A0ABR4D8J1_9PEZI